jgi:hypothetical protein
VHAIEGIAYIIRRNRAIYFFIIKSAGNPLCLQVEGMRAFLFLIFYRLKIVMSCKEFFYRIGGYKRRLVGVKSCRQRGSGFQETLHFSTLRVIQW